MGDIRVLPELITNQIAAGEVVERPVSVVKELMENALDAHATHIVVEVERGGRDLIRVSDNGDGMSRDNALLSIERYATSKIATTEDLFSIATLGFRGEALPSIASVSKMTITTREQAADYGTRLFLSGGKLMEVSEIGAPPGTVVEIKHLYFNTPVRRKFLKTVNTEMGHIADAFSAIAMGARGVGFSLIHNGRSVKEIDCDDPLISRVSTVLANDPDLRLHPVRFRDKNIEIRGYVSHPVHTRSSSQRIQIFVNGRMVTDRGIVSALVQAYRGRLMKGRFPLAALFFTIPFDGVDVNVHPAKLQVRFVNEKAVYHAVRESVIHALVSAEKSAVASRKCDRDVKSPVAEDALPGGGAEKKMDSASSQELPPCHDDIEVVEESGSGSVEKKIGTEFPHPSLFQWGSDSKGGACDNLNTPESFSHSESSLQKEGDGDENKDVNWDSKENEGVSSDRVSDGGVRTHAFIDDSSELLSVPHEFNTLREECRIVGQVMATYIIVEKDDGVELIDQHAAHERITYERLKKRSQSFKPPSQQMMVPHVLDFNFSQSVVFKKMIPGLCELGFEIEPFGEKAYAVKSVPAIIDSIDVTGLLHDMVDNLMDSGLADDEGELEKKVWLDACLILMACHHSVRANQALSFKEMEHLVRDLDLCENAFYCPHGRPIRVLWSSKDFQQMFKRIV
ncbi:DNA mismatch repair protein MutL [Desulfocicer vacuolatum DSM 3385]|uniref:DNA mismatch repair protein MutL n=1 Tax=Desulfocicer vacuolatum DSM 3385 TaxID=1121400 RepID=A0A1W2C3G8_9BACT|nr:DNA mismatch repair endonuclease MutL [Desulfocicer vacuolatum]SMC79646.1 DNA mismatch repair protein MutL [Desulfocicer vacuolatum DSM 3385]